MPRFDCHAALRRFLTLLLALASVVPAAAADPDRYLVTQGGETPYLGVQLREETRHAEGGALVREVVEGSPAAQAGVLEGDIIVAFDGEVVRGPVAVTERIHAASPGDRVTIAVIRDGRRRQIEIELGDRAKLAHPFAPLVWSADGPMRHQNLQKMQGELHEHMQRLGRTFDGSRVPFVVGAWGRPKLGVQLVEATRELRNHLGGSEEVGVLVSKVLSNTPAERAGIAVGDMIVSVDGASVASSDELIRALRDKDGRTIDVGIVRDRRSLTLEVVIPESEASIPDGPRADLRRMPRLAPRPPAASAPPARIDGLAAPAPPRIPAPPAASAPPAPPSPPFGSSGLLAV